MRDPKRFSTNGWTTGVEDGSDFVYGSGSNISLLFYFGDNLDYFTAPARDHKITNQQVHFFTNGSDSDSNDLEFKFREGESEENGDVPLYAVFSSEKRAEIEAVLRNVGPYRKNPYNKEDNQTYYLTGFWSSGQAKDESEGWFEQSFPQGEAERQDFYVFTSLDPIAEFMDLLTGTTPDSTHNQHYYFMYTASPKITTNFVDDDALPEVAELTVEISTPDELKTADVPVISAPNGVKQETITLPGGEQVETEISTPTLPQAPTVTLNHIQESATNPGTLGVTPTDPGDSQSENPDAGQPDVTPPSATADEGTPTTTPIKAPGNDTVANGKVQKLGLKAAGVKVHQQATSGSDQPVTTGWAGDQQAGRMAANDVRSAGAADALATKASNSAATSLPQTDEQRSGLAAWIGSWLLALAGVSLIKRRKKQD
jgi:LPXTG-motif cell wall-anchored protein